MLSIILDIYSENYGYVELDINLRYSINIESTRKTAVVVLLKPAGVEGPYPFPSDAARAI